MADANELVPARKYADVFYQVSVLDIEGVKAVAQKEQVDFIITVCADQVLQVVAQVSEMLHLPCYIDFETAQAVSKKSYMKQVFTQNNIPTSQYIIADSLDMDTIRDLSFPLIVKPVDSYSSRGVTKVVNPEDLPDAFNEAVRISRTNTAIVEEFIEGDELTVDVYVEDGVSHVLCVSRLSKIGEDGKFIIHRTENPVDYSENVNSQIREVAQLIADAFGLKNSPMLIQLITDGQKISVVEFCARTGGGDKFRLIKKVSGFDVIDAVVELTLGGKPHYEQLQQKNNFITNEFLYCKPGVFDHIEGMEKLLADGIITEYYILKSAGHRFNAISSSGDRVAYYTVEAASQTELKQKRMLASQLVRAVDANGNDLLRHDLIVKER